MFLPGLRVRIKELAEEARIIRREASKHPGWAWKLHDHRRGVVRPAARSYQLAYAFLRNRPYRTVEPTTHSEPNWDEVKRISLKFSETNPSWEKRRAEEINSEFDTWRQTE